MSRYGQEVSQRILQVARVIQIARRRHRPARRLDDPPRTRSASIFARRREIEVMKLVGATNWFVRGPFMLEGLLTGLVGSLAAVVLLPRAKSRCRS